MTTLRVAAVQASPVYLDRVATLKRAEDLIRDAASKGARLIAMGETWFPGYPAWLDYCPDVALWDHAPVKEVFQKLRENSIVVPGDETRRLAALCKEFNVTLVIGVNERVDRGPGNGTLYNTMLCLDATGKLVNHHRKLVPTYTERLVWGPGDGAGLQAVQTSAGRIGGLICWEHWMPMARQILHNSGEQVHVALWPSVKDMHQVASRHYAFEGRCFVIAVGLLMKACDLPAVLQKPDNLKETDLVLKGGSTIYAPDGSCIAGPVYDQETILVADLDLGQIDREKMTLDVSGHYSRPDVFSLKVRRKRQ